MSSTRVTRTSCCGFDQEWWGVTDEVKRQAQHLSNTKGYRVLIPDLYKGKIGVDAEEASHVSRHSLRSAPGQDYSLLYPRELHMTDAQAAHTTPVLIEQLLLGGAPC